jgi:hypothetical protein
MAPLEVKCEVVEPSKRELTLQFWDGETLRANLVLSASDLETLIAVLASKRAQMKDPVPTMVTEGDQIQNVQRNPEWYCGFPGGHSGRLLAIRHDGFGWLGFQLPVERARALSMALTDEQSLPTQPTGKPN